MHILSIDRNKSPLQISGKVAGCVVRTLKNFRAPIYWAHRAVFFAIAQLSRVISTVDYCNSLLAGVPQFQLDRLQSVLNTAARLLIGAKKHDRIKHVLRDRLHWLRVPQRVQFKLCLLTFKALHGLAPPYIADLCRPVTLVGSRQRLRSAHSPLD